ncbi:uncharacterized protein LOC116844355 [Odontomachus brunneus]|uniref:uncharacterized protein LOC116844355 n=1 Tax=Odontomachus brunneus TaxID=486640 RepID=UPI0013F22C5F|nr:uncharacterized protein LOC116844355 [Odontomachus brunneus]
MDVVGCYAPPSWTRAEFGALLDRLEALIMRRLPRPIIVSGDFNAHSTGTCPCGADLQEWVASAGLSLQNRGRESTFVGWQGESIVDLTWTSAAAARQVQGWRVATEAETGSDHRYIELCLVVTRREVLSRRSSGLTRLSRWTLTSLNRDKFVAVICAANWDEARPAAYWWSAEIAELRRSAGRIWRAMAALQDRDTRVAASAVLTAKRGASKALAWEDLISSVDRDPWGHPYRMVMRRLRPWAPPLMDILASELLDKIVEGLFPRMGNNISPYTGPSFDWQEDSG